MRLRALAPLVPALALLAPATALAGWSAPAPLTPRDGAAHAAPQVAAEGGRAVAVWVRAPAGTSGRARVQVASRPTPAGRWTPPRDLSGVGTDQPRVAINARGDAAVVWVAGRRLVAAVRRGPEGPWSAAAVAEGGGAIEETRVVVDRSGRPTVLWSERSGPGFLVRVAARASAASGWSVRGPRISTPGPDPPSVALSRGGALVAWEDDGSLRVARTSRGAFERPSEPAKDASGPAAAIGGTGAGLTAWSTALPGGTSVMLAAGRSPEAAAWSVSSDVGIGLRPVAALNDRGDAVVAWSLDEQGGAQGVEAAMRRGPGGSWRASTVVPRRTCACALVAGGAAVDGRGTAIVSWHRDDGGTAGGGGAASLSPAATSWAPARVRPGRLGRAPAIAADPVSGGVAVWAETGGPGGVRAVTLRP